MIRILGAAGHGIDFQNAVDGRFRNNVILADLTTAFTPDGLKFNIYGGGNNTFAGNFYNDILESDSDDNYFADDNIVLAVTEAAYTVGAGSVLDDPLGSGDVEDDYAVTSGLVGGAGTGYINYIARTYAIPPYLAGGLGTDTLDGTADVSVHTDAPDGNIYAVVTASDTAPSFAQIKAHHDHLGATALDSATIPVTAPGTYSFGATGLPSSCYAYFAHEDADTLQSNVAASSVFGVTSVSVPTARYGDDAVDTGSAVSGASYLFEDMDIGTAHADRVVLLAVWASSAPTTAPTVGGVSMTSIVSTAVATLRLYRLTTAGTAVENDNTADIVITNNAVGTSGSCWIATAICYPATKTPLDSGTDTDGSTTDSVVNLDVVDGGFVFYAAQGNSGGAFSQTWGGSDTPVEDYDTETEGTSHVAGHIDTTEAGTFNLTLQEVTSGSKGLVAVSFDATGSVAGSYFGARYFGPRYFGKRYFG